MGTKKNFESGIFPTKLHQPLELVIKQFTYPSSSVFCDFQVRTTGYGVTSLTTNSRTLKVGDNIAHCRAQPRATASSAFRVVLTSLSKSAFITSLTAGIRVLPPTTSMASTSAILSPAIKFLNMIMNLTLCTNMQQ